MLAQSDSLLPLPMVEVVATSLRHAQPGSFVEKWSGEDLTMHQGTSVAEFLHQKAGIYLKSYGLGSLATTAIRGASASQTVVLWNGLPVQSPMLGLLDWSLLPLQFTDEVSFQHGGNSAAWGSGAIGGAVLMDNLPQFDKGLYGKIQAGLGSFGWQHQALNLGHGGKKWAFSSRFFHQKAENDFPYRPAAGLPENKMTNAQQWRYGQMISAHWRPNGQHLFGLMVWWQKADRHIPPTIVQNISEAKLVDNQLRNALTWEHLVGKNAWSAKAAFFHDNNRYLDSYNKIRNDNRFWTGISEINYNRTLSAVTRLSFSLNHQLTQAQTKNYGEARRRNQAALYASLRHHLGRWSGHLDVRMELADKQVLPFTPSFGVDWSPWAWLKIGAKIGRHFRLPTLNDLHWRPGGNPDLNPESGWSEELNLRFFKKAKGQDFSLATSVYNRNIKNWIQWRPVEGQPIWSASNIAGVKSRGVEARAHWALEQGSWQCRLDLGYDHVRSTHQAALAIPKIEKGQQLYYVPENQGFVGGEIGWGGATLAYRHQFTDAVLTDLGLLSGYHIGTARVSYDAMVFAQKADFHFSIENIWDTSYQVIERRPMPGRTWQLGVAIEFAKH
ncbi:MAG: TonB-dependent receptor [Saprospiraceae bacterium]|nr:TonB-dependent receptor [Saprospiraceae bacterium]